jgi:predicted RNase H-like HicB family nuclease
MVPYAPGAEIQKANEGGYVAWYPSFPGCFTQGETAEELLRNLAEALDGYLVAQGYGNAPSTEAHPIIRVLKKLSFRVTHQQNGHVMLAHSTKSQIICVPIFVKAIKRSLFNLILKHAKIREEEFLRLL